MGLDVYISRYEDYEATNKRKRDREKASERLWMSICGDGSYQSIPEYKKEAYRAELKKVDDALGLIDGDDPTEERIELPSTKFPDHCFKIGYFRSSYNEGGYNHVARNHGLLELDDIFAHRGEEYACVHDWNKSRERAVRALEAMKARSDKIGNLVVLRQDALPIRPDSCPTSEAAAMDIVESEFGEKNAGGFKAYSNDRGLFYREACYKLRAVIPGVSEGNFRGPVVYLVVEGDEPALTWYIQATEIVIETIDYILAQKDPEKYRMCWSG